MLMELLIPSVVPRGGVPWPPEAINSQPQSPLAAGGIKSKRLKNDLLLEPLGIQDASIPGN